MCNLNILVLTQVGLLGSYNERWCKSSIESLCSGTDDRLFDPGWLTAAAADEDDYVSGVLVENCGSCDHSCWAY